MTCINFIIINNIINIPIIFINSNILIIINNNIIIIIIMVRRIITTFYVNV